MKRAARTDRNHREIVAALHKAGCSVQSLASVGRGTPDLLIGRAGRNYLMEVKDGTKPPSARRLTEDQKIWHAGWRGQVVIVETVADALQAIGENTDE